MPERNNLHVTKGDGCWNVKAEGEDTPVAQTRTQKEAIDAARQMLMDNPIGGEIMIHGRDGRIRDNRTINRKDNPYSKG
ncbi:MAG: DUF2188 domain-containing protein [Thermomicrobiales bacterium]|nr:DUF2188 domain-containing protein [Thermomicrobiales bacterium]MCO5218858.1 DUF2188 domain-containing protein [Thermomicrobiales bacterium]MCO5225703.1 DUF2188 domain-containing protein [Thermomicrobiales bacterium]MCO5227946.1 DUF2188 domain-containing protein [Thermomicrobiales bacterium]